jgi:2'-5' RNA ligase
MKRALHIFPSFSPASGVQAYRSRHDPLALCIPPHITLVFPFVDEIADAELIRHIEDTVGSHRRFSIGFSSPIVFDDRFIWLPVREPVDVVAGMHAKLYGGMLKKHLRPDIPYHPHVTLGTARENNAEELLREARKLSPAPEYQVESLVLESIGPGEESGTIATISLK